jgi:hypothetical protein
VTSRHIRTNRAIALVAVTALASGVWMLHDGTGPDSPPQPSAADAFATAAAAVTGGARSAAPGTAPGVEPLPASMPVRLRIPAIQVDAPVTTLDLNGSRQLQVPDETNRNLAGWYRGGPAPGSTGNAIMDGHVDTHQGPAVFYLLGALHKGSTVEVDRKDGTTAVFTVDAVEVYRKSAFPSARVYGPTRDPELRLITCGGGYDRKAGYLGNVVLYAHLTGSGNR